VVLADQRVGGGSITIKGRAGASQLGAISPVSERSDKVREGKPETREAARKRDGEDGAREEERNYEVTEEEKSERQRRIITM